MHILRGQYIEEMTTDDLCALAEQIDTELPTLIDHLGAGDLARLFELELIEDELERRKHL
jgi:hypothetical protein